jgi:peptidoglycan/LPS O-acetylase OafA/YrhL
VVAVTLLVIVVLGGRNSPLSRLLSTRGFVAIGRWSYGIFLWHFPLLVILQDDISYPDGPAGLAFRLLWILVLTIPLAAATYAWVEHPAILWSQRLPGEMPPVADAASSTVASSDPGQRDVRDLRDQSLPTGTQPKTASSTTSAQQTAPNPTQPRKVPPAE